MMRKLIPMESRIIQFSAEIFMWKWNSVVSSVQCADQKENDWDG